MNGAGTLLLQTTNPNEMLTLVRQRLVSKSFFGLRASMGAGKTTFISELLSDKGVMVSSPTFALYNTYSLQDFEIIHVDLYRLKSSEEIDSSGFWDLFADQNSVILTEWVDRIQLSELPLDWIKWLLEIKISANNERVYSLFQLG